MEHEKEKEQVAQQPNPEYQEQFQRQANIVNNRESQLYAVQLDKYKRRIENPTIRDRLKLTKPVKPPEKPKTTAKDMAHAEALRVNEVVDKMKKNKPWESSQKIAETVLSSPEFGLKTPEELKRREMLIHYYPEIVRKVYEADTDGAWKILIEESYKEGSPANKNNEIGTALEQLCRDVLFTIYKVDDTEAQEKIAAKNIFLNGKFKTKELGATRQIMATQPFTGKRRMTRRK